MRVRAALTAVVVAVLAGVGTLVGLTAQAATGCQVTWTANSWPGGFTADVRVSPGDAAHGWTLTWAFPSGQRVTQGWNANVVQTGSSVTASNAAWNGEIPAGGSTSFGFQGTFSGTNTAPDDVRAQRRHVQRREPDGHADADPDAHADTDPTPTPTAHAHADADADRDTDPDPDAHAHAHRPAQPRLQHGALLRRPRVPDRDDPSGSPGP